MAQTTYATMLIWAVLTFFDHFDRKKRERRKNQLTSTRPVGFAAGKKRRHFWTSSFVRKRYFLHWWNQWFFVDFPGCRFPDLFPTCSRNSLDICRKRAKICAGMEPDCIPSEHFEAEVSRGHSYHLCHACSLSYLTQGGASGAKKWSQNLRVSQGGPRGSQVVPGSPKW